MRNRMLVLVMVGVMFFGCQIGGKDSGGKDLSGVKVAFVIANVEFQDEEYYLPKKVLEDGGVSVVTVAKTTDTAKGMLGGEVQPDLALDNLVVDDYKGIVFIGGTGASIYHDDETAHAIIQEAIEKNEIVAAICIAPATLANAGVLGGKKATSYSDVYSVLKERGSVLVDEPVVDDGKIITADGPGSAKDFGIAILKMLESM